MAKVFATAKGAAMKENTWVEGQEISCSQPLADLFIEKGVATAEKVEPETISKPNSKKSK